MRKRITLGVLCSGAVIGLALLWITRRRSEWRLPPAWQRTLVKQHGPLNAGRMVESTNREYSDLLAESTLPANRALLTHLTQNILPGLALYRVLLSELGGDRPAALAAVDDVFRAWTEERTRLLFAPAKILPVPFWLFKLAFGYLMKAYPSEGWTFEPVENSNTRIAFNATRCFYLNTLTALGAPELTASFCKTDEVMAELFPGSIQFVRSQTLGRGGDRCDFQYCVKGRS